MNTHTTDRPTLGHVVRRAVAAAALGFVIVAAAFATVAVLVNQMSLHLSYGAPT